MLSFLLSFFRRFHSGTPDGRQLPFGSGNLETRIRAITERHSLLPSSQLRISNSVPYGCACPNCSGRRYGISTFRVFDNEYLRSTLSTGGIVVRVGSRWRDPNHPRTFWSKPLSPFGLFAITAITRVHLGWPYDLILTPHPDRASRRASASRLLPRISQDASAHFGEAPYPPGVHQGTHAPLGSRQRNAGFKRCSSTAEQSCISDFVSQPT